jgi:transposase
MAALQKKISHGCAYWYIVECRRIKGKPTPIVLAYLGSTERLVNQLLAQAQAGSLRITSCAHGAVAALWQVASEIGLIPLLNQHLPAQRRDGLSVGETLTLAAIHRVLKPASKRSFSEWAATTTLPALARFSPPTLTSQHFWDQMAAVSGSALESIEEVLARKLVAELGLTLDLLFYDTTNFFTYLASSNERSDLCRRGHNKQKRMDLRQFNLALLVSRATLIPLFSAFHDGNPPDHRQFPLLLGQLRRRLTAINQEVEDLTLVLDKGNQSAAIQETPSRLKLHWVGSLSSVYRRVLLEAPSRSFYELELANGSKVLAHRCEQEVFGQQRLVVVIQSERLRVGQLRGFTSALAQALQELAALQTSLATGPRRTDPAAIQARIARLLAREHLAEVVKMAVEVVEGRVRISYAVDQPQCEHLKTEVLGKKILFTNRRDWTEREVIEAYYGLGRIERVFRHLKDPWYLAVRPQYHWTDQKIRVHTFCCLLGLMMVGLLDWKAKRAGIKIGSARLLDQLGRIRESVVIEASGGPGKPRIRRQLEEMSEERRRPHAAMPVGIHTPHLHK